MIAWDKTECLIMQFKGSIAIHAHGQASSTYLSRIQYLFFSNAVVPTSQPSLEQAVPRWTHEHPARREARHDHLIGSAWVHRNHCHGASIYGHGHISLRSHTKLTLWLWSPCMANENLPTFNPTKFTPTKFKPMGATINHPCTATYFLAKTIWAIGHGRITFTPKSQTFNLWGTKFDLNMRQFTWKIKQKWTVWQFLKFYF